jgi:hypothetical protein
MTAAPHPQIEPLASLLGTWRGNGEGHYPTIASFRYVEEVRFWHTGRPWLGYEQRTWHPETAAPMHSESGYWRPLPDGRLEIVLAHAFGITELLEGRRANGKLELRSTAVVSTPTAKQVEAVERAYDLDGDLLSYEVGMAFGGHPMQNHLKAELRRV